MLQIENIKKDYQLKDQTVNALKGVSICFRRSEFVSILGQSGCGKTTLLNIIGGLDRYTSGDLLVDGVSTKSFKEKDWNNYRNHRIGFVFQSYNLIPHQTVLENVELALTLSGIKRKERKVRAIEVLTKVGLGDKLKSKPNQLSGGQMQRVAIARALVNDPEIILADEPTGALDSKTSVQIMDILKQISKDRLVIMVTHNPELAEKYSSRIVKLLDGEIIQDSKPYSIEEAQKEIEKHKNEQNVSTFKKTEKKKSMSFWTALSLSIKNLFTKKARTILVSFAGSIGIIGIALILALSSGFQTYVDQVQESTLSSYPITIEASSIDYTSILSGLMATEDKSADHNLDAIYSNDSITEMLNKISSSMKSNDLQKFYAYLKQHKSEIDEYVNDVQITYNINIDVFNSDNMQIAPQSSALYDVILSYSLTFLQMQTLDTDEPNVNNPGLIITEQPDGTYQITLNTLATAVAQQKANYAINTYLEDSVLKQQFFDNNTVNVNENAIIGIITKLTGINISQYKSMDLGTVSQMINNTELIYSQYEVVASSLNTNDVLGNLQPNQAVLVLDKNSEIDDYVLYALGLIDKTELMADISATMAGQKSSLKVNYLEALTTYKTYKVLVDSDYFVSLTDDENYVYLKDENHTTDYANQIDSLINNSTNELEIVAVLRAKDTNGCLSSGINYTSEFVESLITYYNNSVAVTGKIDNNTNAVFEDNYKLSALSLDNPKAISFYLNSFADKDKVIKFINDYNDKVSDSEKITYNDYVGLIMSSVTTIINAITYVLIAFVSISLVVSSIMIGIITYISVLERIKEIGILRSIGASKRDIKHVFTAESVIIGFVAGVFGIVITLLLTIPINIIIKAFTGIAGVAVLPWLGAIVLVAISVLLTFVAGLIPAKLASKKDPVLALRSE